MSAKTSGAMSGAASGASAGSSFGPWGAAIGGVVGGLGGYFGAEEEVEPPTPMELAAQTAEVERFHQGKLYGLRSDYDSKFDQLNQQQLGRTQKYMSGMQRGIASDISRDRRSLNEADMAQFREQSAGFAGSERLQAMLQAQAEQELALGGRLSGEQERDVAQGSQAHSFQRGRGVGNFSIGQLALSRFGAQEAIKDKRRGFAGQTIQSGLNVSNPFQNIMRGNIGTTGSILDRLRNSQNFSQHGRIDYNPISDSILSANQMATTGQQDFNQRQSERSDDMFGGALSSIGSIFGSQSGGGGGGSGY